MLRQLHAIIRRQLLTRLDPSRDALEVLHEIDGAANRELDSSRVAENINHYQRQSKKQSKINVTDMCSSSASPMIFSARPNISMSFVARMMGI